MMNWKQVQVLIEEALVPIRKELEAGHAENLALRKELEASRAESHASQGRIQLCEQSLDTLTATLNEALRIEELTTTPGFGVRHHLQNAIGIARNARCSLRGHA